MADAGDLKSLGVIREGSSPSLGTMQIKNQTTIEPLHPDGHLNEVTLTFTHNEKRRITMTKKGVTIKVALNDKEYERFKNGL